LPSWVHRRSLRSPDRLAGLPAGARPSVGCGTVDYEGNRATSGRITHSEFDRASFIAPVLRHRNFATSGKQLTAISNPRHSPCSTRSVAIPVCRVTGRSGSAGPLEIRVQPIVQLRDYASGDLRAALDSIAAARFLRARHAGNCVSARNVRLIALLRQELADRVAGLFHTRPGEGRDSDEGPGVVAVGRELAPVARASVAMLRSVSRRVRRIAHDADRRLAGLNYEERG
jgi:hypothetical protein